VHIISRKRLLEATQDHGDLCVPLDVWYRLAKKRHMEKFDGGTATVSDSRSGWEFTAFNIKGNAYG